MWTVNQCYKIQYHAKKILSFFDILWKGKNIYIQNMMQNFSYKWSYVYMSIFLYLHIRYSLLFLVVENPAFFVRHGFSLVVSPNVSDLNLPSPLQSIYKQTEWFPVKHWDIKQHFNSPAPTNTTRFNRWRNLITELRVHSSI